MERKVDVAIIGAGTAGINAMSEVRKVTDRFVMIDGGVLGTTCARVGCMPSKVLIQIADDYHRRGVFETLGIQSAERLSLDLERSLANLRKLRDGFVGGIIDEVIAPLGNRFIRGHCEFIEPNLLQVDGTNIRAARTVIAAGSRPVVPEPWRRFGDRLLTTDTLFEQRLLPHDVAVVGLGVVGLEIGQALARMGINIVGFDALDRIGGLQDPEVNREAIEIFGRDLPIHLNAEVDLQEANGRLRVEGGGASVVVGGVLLSIGRISNADRLHLDRLGLKLDARGLPPYDEQTLQVEGLPVFIAGDVNDARPVLHEALHEGKVAGYNAARERPVAFRRKAPLVIAFTDPNVCRAGASWADVAADNPVVGQARFAGGREKIMLREEGLIRIYGQPHTGRILGAEMAAPAGEHLAHQLAWAIQQGQTAADLLAMPFYHPAVEETLQKALRDLADRAGAAEGPLAGFQALPA